MQLLLDTHIFLWAITDDRRLSSNSLDLITTTASSVLLRYVSIWEIAIKHSLARSDMPISAAQAIQWAADSGFNLLPIKLPHLLCLEQLPLHHRDPFDRLLVAQSICESLTILSADRALKSYGCLFVDAT